LVEISRKESATCRETVGSETGLFAAIAGAQNHEGATGPWNPKRFCLPAVEWPAAERRDHDKKFTPCAIAAAFVEHVH